MSNGSIINGSCIIDSSAADIYFSSLAPSINSGFTTYQTYLTKISGIWNYETIAIDSGGLITLVYTTAAQLPLFPACDTTEKFFDGLAIGSLVVVAMAATWAINAMRRAL